MTPCAVLPLAARKPPAVYLMVCAQREEENAHSQEREKTTIWLDSRAYTLLVYLR